MGCWCTHIFQIVSQSTKKSIMQYFNCEHTTFLFWKQNCKRTTNSDSCCILQSNQLGLTVKMSSTKTYETPNKMQSVPCCTDLNSFTGQIFWLITCHLQRHMIEWNTESMSLLAVVQNSVNWITTENSDIYQSFRLYLRNQKIIGRVHLHHLKQSLYVTSFNPKYEQIISLSYVCARETQFPWFWPLNHP
jgi:hypothetical protein